MVASLGGKHRSGEALAARGSSGSAGSHLLGEATIVVRSATAIAGASSAGDIAPGADR